jgi:hypothetical protein
MKEILKIEIECGEKTCAVKPGKFCHMINHNMFGDPSCFLFGKLENSEEDGTGWTLRHKKCLKNM